MQVRASAWVSTALVIVGAGSQALAGTVIASSDFSANADGWNLIDANGGGTASATYFSTGGNPGGYIRGTDVAGDTSFNAPSKFLGNMSAAIGDGGGFALDLRVADHDLGALYPMLFITNGTLKLQYFAGLPQNGVFTNFVIPTATNAAGWLKVTTFNFNATGSAATAAELQAVMSSLTAVRVLADWKSGADLTDFDNFQILSAGTVNAVPLPSAALSGLSMFALAAVGALLRRRSRTR